MQQPASPCRGLDARDRVPEDRRELAEQRASQQGLVSPGSVAGSREAQLSRDPANFRGLVLGCIETKFCK